MSRISASETLLSLFAAVMVFQVGCSAKPRDYPSDDAGTGGSDATGGTSHAGGSSPATTTGGANSGGASSSGGNSTASSGGSSSSIGGTSAAAGNQSSGGTAGVGGTTATTVACPGTAGPTMVRVPEGYCIDSTEVTREQYQFWLASNPTTTGQISDCSWNTSFALDSTCIAGSAVCQGASCGNQPVVCVDWCDAYAYCKAVGKRLCGKIGGSSNDFGSYADASMSQWYNACSSHAQSTYPYGNTYSAQACNGADHGTGNTVAVGTLATCQSAIGNYSGIYDMSGNVWEWEDSCNGSGATANCQLRGGSFYSAVGSTSCLIVYTSANNANVRNHAVDSFGFRCCS